ncbi:MAG: hypothetical protein HeimC3_39830 [Candidatus Heimdallarchaeota archaeon LC_3]|nr:MAG: hypothetical protein HeimC3_39830 [Candidatus Heimdallarchaeota archaeon LC_3]
MKTEIFFKLSSFQVLAYFRRGMFYAFLSLYLHFVLGFSVTESTFFATFSMLASSIAQSFIWGPIADKIYNRKYMVVWSEILAAIGIFIVWWLHNQAYTNYSPYIAGWVITIGLTFVETIWSASNVAWAALLADVTEQKDRSSMMGRLGAFGGIGRMIGVGAAALLYSYGGNEGGGFLLGPLFFLTSLVIFLTAIIMQSSVSNKDLVYRDKERKSSIDSSVQDSSINPNRNSFNVILFTLFLISLALINFGRNSVVIISNFFLVHRFNANELVIGAFEGISSFSIIVAGLITPLLVRKLGDWKVYMIATVFVMISLIAFVFSPFLLLTLIFGFNIWFVHLILEATSYSIVAGMIPPHSRGKLFGIYNAAFFLSWGIGGTFFTGPITDYLINSNFDEVYAYTVAYISAALVVFLGLILALFIYYKYSKKHEKLSKQLI